MFLIVSVGYQVTGEAQILIEGPEASTVTADADHTEESKPVYVSPRVGKSAATDYFKKREAHSQKSGRTTASSSDRVLMIHLGKFINDKAYRWGKKDSAEDVGNAIFGVTYRVGEWKSSMDLYIRTEFISYSIDNQNPLKLSFMPIIAFPDARSEFPLYFGAGAGAGIFFKQVGNESDLSLDYCLVIGARFSDIFEAGGLFIESGMKGHLHLLASGQHDGVYLAAGGIFNF